MSDLVLDDVARARTDVEPPIDLRARVLSEIGRPHARPFEMRGREVSGWLRVDPEGVGTKRQLEPWVQRGVRYARALPPKR